MMTYTECLAAVRLLSADALARRTAAHAGLAKAYAEVAAAEQAYREAKASAWQEVHAQVEVEIQSVFGAPMIAHAEANEVLIERPTAA